jgi:hypothetical protein
MRLETLIQQARILASEAALRMSTRLRQDDRVYVANSQALDRAMNAVLDLSELPGVFARFLPPIPMNICHIALYAGDGPAFTSRARLAVSYTRGQSQFHPDSAAYPATDLLPAPLWPPAERTTW